MAPGSVIIDLAGESGGNCELTKAGETVVENGVKVIAPTEPRQRHGRPRLAALRQEPRELHRPDHLRGGRSASNFDDEVVAGACLTHGGEIRNERAKSVVEGCLSSMDLVIEFTIFVLAAFVGFEVISKVPTTLHTPLMSQTNAIHGIVMLGGLIVAGFADGALELTLAFIAIAFGTINIVGGFLVTDRMLGMFSRKKPEAEPTTSRGADPPMPRPQCSSRAAICRRCSTSSPSRCSSSGSSRGRRRRRPSAAT